MIARHGVGIMLHNAAGACAFLERRGAHGPGTWGLPGGKIEPGETIVAAAVREAAEEVGVLLDPDEVVVGPWTDDHFMDAPRYITHYARCRVPDGQRIRRIEHHKCSAIGIFQLDSPPRPFFLPLENLVAKRMLCIEFAERTGTESETLRKETSTDWTPAIR